jgi:hypothetical protein
VGAEVLLGTPPPPPPPNVPDIEATAESEDGRLRTCASAWSSTAQPGVRVVPSHDRSDRPRARELRRDRRLADQGQRARRSTRRARSYDGTPLAGRRICARAAEALAVLVQTFTENLMTFALGRRLGPRRHAGAARDRARGGAASARLSAFVLGDREEPGVSDEERRRRRSTATGRRPIVAT